MESYSLILTPLNTNNEVFEVENRSHLYMLLMNNHSLAIPRNPKIRCKSILENIHLFNYT